MKNKTMFASIVVMVIISLTIFIPVTKNNIILNNFANQLYSLPLPPDTVVVMKEDGVGHLGGSASMLNFWAYIEARTSMSEEELIKYYIDKPINSANNVSFLKPKKNMDYVGDIDAVIQIEVIHNQVAYRNPYNPKAYHKIVKVNDSIDNNLYIIQICDSGYKAGWDLRAH